MATHQSTPAAIGESNAACIRQSEETAANAQTVPIAHDANSGRAGFNRGQRIASIEN
jgi:hypothetical protein